MIFDVISYWLGVVLVLTGILGLLMYIWVRIVTTIWSLHSNLMLTRHYCLHVKGEEFVQWMRDKKVKK